MNKEKLLQDYIFTAKYSRIKNNKKETWEDSVNRVMQMHQKQLELKGVDMEKMTPYLNLVKKAYLNKEILGAQRALQWGGDQIFKHNFRLYNCSASHANRISFFDDLMYVLLTGAGVGYSVQKHHVEQLPVIQTVYPEIYVHTVEDSIEGWAYAIKALTRSYFVPGFGNTIKYDFSKIRKKGELIACEFKSPGHKPLEKALGLINLVFKNAIGRKLTPLEVHEIACIIADAVISGGVRRSALISLFSVDDEDMLKCKTGDWFYKKPYLARSNNSAVILPNTPKHQYEEIFRYVKEYGEPGFAFLPDAEMVVNPCFEVGMYPHLLDEEGNITGSGFSVCNLTTINGKSITDEESFYAAAKTAAILGTIQASYTDFKYVSDTTKEIVERDALIGVSITGMAENQDILFNPEYQTIAAEIVKTFNREVAEIIGINSAVRTTVIKPEGTTSLMLGTASGIHPFHYYRYIRNVQANSFEQSVQIMESVNPEMVKDSVWSAGDKVISFPIEKDDSAILISEDLSAIKLLELVKSTYINWIKPGTDLENTNQGKIPRTITHNVSNTITVQDDEWEEVEQYIWDNKEFFSGISLIPASGDLNYAQAPYIKVLDEVELSELYGPASILAGGLNVDGIHAFGDLWVAIDTAMGKGESLVFEENKLTDIIKKHIYVSSAGEASFNYSENGLRLDNVNSILATMQDSLKKKKEWVDRFNRFSYKYFDGDIVTTGECLKRVSIFHQWNQLLFAKNVHWEDYTWVKTVKEAGSDIATACSGGSCEIIY
jgi:ribonucleoside-diphosphate reductase alpha chain